jgi:hypothetical protein
MGGSSSGGRVARLGDLDAHGYTAHGNTICNSGSPSQSRDPWTR